MIDGRIQVALLGCPNLPCDASNEEATGNNITGKKIGTLLYAIRGSGSWALPLDGESDPRPVHASTISDPRRARFCESVEAAHTAQGLAAKVAAMLGIDREPLRLDSQAKYAVVARGEAEIYLRLPAKFGYKEKIWDHAGGVLIVEEAGGSVCDVTGKPLEFNHGHELLANRGVVAANRPLHPRVLEALHEIYKTLPPAQQPTPQ